MLINPKFTLENVGGKGLQLFRLREVASVPDFFVIKFDNYSEVLEEDTQRTIIQYFDKSGYKKVAVRSSATMEDSLIASFAGMFETELNIDRSHLLSAINKVLLSANSQRVKEYCKLRGFDFGTVKMRIVVQEMVDSRVAGVCFTRENHDTENILIEACYGLGEALVSGKVTPDTYRVERNSDRIFECNIGFQKIMYNKETIQMPIRVPFHKQNAKKLTDKEIIEVARVCMTIENALSYYAADIEWAYDNEGLKMLQVRPFVGVF